MSTYRVRVSLTHPYFKLMLLSTLICNSESLRTSLIHSFPVGFVAMSPSWRGQYFPKHIFTGWRGSVSAFQTCEAHVDTSCTAPRRQGARCLQMTHSHSLEHSESGL